MRRLLPTLTLVSTVFVQQADLRGIYVYTNDVSQITKATAANLTQSFNSTSRAWTVSP